MDINNIETKIVRFRCYGCGKKEVVSFDETINSFKEFANENTNTIVCCCDPCSERYEREGPFWIDN